ncbi:MAG: hypothetical protein M0Z95_28605 [Actinomycetota bacterium]|nr:hypothetical protein [Actinomycetota bacterium]
MLTLGLYGDFSSGMDGVTQLLTFGREATFGKPITQPGQVQTSGVRRPPHQSC